MKEGLKKCWKPLWTTQKCPTPNNLRQQGFRAPSQNTYLLLTEFEVRTVSYRPSFFPFDLRPKHVARSHKSKGRKRGSVTYSTDWEDEVSKIFITSLLCVWRVRKRFLFSRTRKGFKFLKHLKSKTSQFEIVFKSLEPYRRVWPAILTNHSVRTNWDI